MMRKLFFLGAVLFAGVLLAMGCGGVGGGTATTGGTPASLASLSAVPTADLSAYDYTTSDVAASISSGLDSSVAAKAERVVKSVVKAAGFADSMVEEGSPSRAGCETNIHKNEIFRMSAGAQLDRCYPEAANKVIVNGAPIMAIPDGSYAYYNLAFAKQDSMQPSDENREKMCDDIRRDEERAACESEMQGEGGGIMSMLMRIGKVDNALRISMCEGAEGAEALVNEATYSLVDTYTTRGTMKRVGNRMGHNEKMSLVYEVKAPEGTTDGSADLGSDGNMYAEAYMSGGFGKGYLYFRADAVDQSNTIKGGFNAVFRDPELGENQNVDASFTGKTHAKMLKTPDVGCAKFGFSGTMPAMRFVDMMPFDITNENKAGFLATMSSDLGIAIDESNYTELLMCPNPNFDYKNPSSTVPPMVLDDGDGLCSETHSDTECFAYANIEETGDSGYTKVRQVFTRLNSNNADVAALFLEIDAVNLDAEIDMTAIGATADAIAFDAGSWDCTAPAGFSTPAFESVMMDPAAGMAMMEATQECMKLQEKVRDNEGMGGWNCAEQVQGGVIDNGAKDGPPEWGAWGGELRDPMEFGGNCADVQYPDFLFVKAVNPAGDEYCLPNYDGCKTMIIPEAGVPPTEFSPAVLIKNPQDFTKDLTITKYNAENTAEHNVVDFYFDGGVDCMVRYTLSQPTFTANNGPQEGFKPQPCIEAGFDTPEEWPKCEALCKQPGVNCYQFQDEGGGAPLGPPLPMPCVAECAGWNPSSEGQPPAACGTCLTNFCGDHQYDGFCQQMPK